jgi:hypothetical protein
MLQNQLEKSAVVLDICAFLVVMLLEASKMCHHKEC